jgi:hypothetical protein
MGDGCEVNVSDIEIEGWGVKVSVNMGVVVEGWLLP